MQEDKWAKLEKIVRRVVKEEIAALKQKPKIELIGGKWIGISQDQKDAWAAAFPALDISVELNLAAAWILSNQHLAPKSHVGRFLHNWLAKGQLQASIRSIPNTRQLPQVCAYCDLPSVGSVNGFQYCVKHNMKAMDGERPIRAVK